MFYYKSIIWLPIRFDWYKGIISILVESSAYTPCLSEHQTLVISVCAQLSYTSLYTVMSSHWKGSGRNTHFFFFLQCTSLFNARDRYFSAEIWTLVTFPWSCLQLTASDSWRSLGEGNINLSITCWPGIFWQLFYISISIFFFFLENLFDPHTLYIVFLAETPGE